MIKVLFFLAGLGMYTVSVTVLVLSSLFGYCSTLLAWHCFGRVWCFYLGISRGVYI